MRKYILPFYVLILSSNVLSQDFEFDGSFDNLSFITPTKSATSIHNSPNSVTKLSSDDLFSLGVETIPDALRLTPGMIVSDLHGSNTQAGYHGLAVSIPRRMDVLFNSSSIYRPGYAGIHWRRLAFTVEDLESIEVLRGSATSDFGSNALTGAVNLIQRPIALEPNVSASIKSESGGVKKYRASFHLGESDNHIYGRFFSEKSDGYDFAVRSPEYDDEFEGKSALFSGEHSLSNNKLVDWNIAYGEYTFHSPSLDFVGNTEILGEDEQAEGTQDSVASIKPAVETNIHSAIKLTDGFSNNGLDTNWNIALKYSLYERDQDIEFCNVQGSFDPLFAQIDASPNIHILPEDFPLMIGTGLATGVSQLNASILSPLSDNDRDLLAQLGASLRQYGPDIILSEICGLASLDSKETRVSLSGQYHKELSENLALTTSLDIIKSSADSKLYLQGKASRDTYQLSTNISYSPIKPISLNVGFMMESDDYLDKPIVSSQINLNYHINSSFTFKSLYSHSKRSPDIHETDRKWQYEVDYLGDTTDFLGQEVGTVFRVARSPDNLKPEEVETVELGFVYASENKNSSFEFKIFNEDLRNMISDPFLYLDFNLTNDGEITKRGAESAWYYQNSFVKYGVAYTYLDWDTSTAYEETLLANHIGSVWSIFKLPYESALGVSFSGHSGGKNNTYRKIDVTYSKKINFGGSDMVVQIGYKRFPDLTYTLTEFTPEDAAAIGYDDPNRYFIKLSASY